MKLKGKNITGVVVTAMFLGLLVGVSIKDKGTEVEITETKTVAENTAGADVDAVSGAAETVNNGIATVAEVEPLMVAESGETETVSGNSIAMADNVILNTEDDDNYVVYIIARVVNPKDTSGDQKFRCVINKNEQGAETGLVDIILDANTVPMINPDTDMNVDEYIADVKVNHAGEWLYTGNYYEIKFTNIDKSKELSEIRLDAIGSADDTAISNWKQGRSLNSTFLADMATIKQSEPSDVYDDICYKLQYTWTFEQIEAFKAYVESLDEESKNKWMLASSELDITIGY